MFAIERHIALSTSVARPLSLWLTLTMRNVVICLALFFGAVTIMAGQHRAWAGPTGSTVISVESLLDGKWPPNTDC